MAYKKKLVSIYPIYENIQIFKYIINEEDKEVDNILKEQKKKDKNGETEYDKAFKEIQNGVKINCWIWYIFPNVFSLRRKHTSKPHFDLKNFYSCLNYLNNEYLANNLINITKEVNNNLTKKYKNKHKSIKDSRIELFGKKIDVIKYYDCITLFSLASKILSSINPVYNKVFKLFCFSINKYHNTDNDHLAILKQDTIIAIRKETKCFYNINSVEELKKLKLKVIY